MFSCYIIGESSLTIRCAELTIERGHTLNALITDDPDVRTWATGHRVPVLDAREAFAHIGSYPPFDYLFSIVNFRIVPPSVLALARKGAINFHDGPLPRYAGLNVTSWALLEGQSHHGITWHFMSDQVDAGGVLLAEHVPIDPGETAFSLNTKCFEAALTSFPRLLERLERDDVTTQALARDQKRYYGLRKRPEGAALLRWHQDAHHLEACVRALDFGPYPNPLGLPKCLIGDDLYLVRGLDVLASSSPELPGTVVRVDDHRLVVTTSTVDVALARLETPDGRPVPLSAVVSTAGLRPGSVLPSLTLDDLERLSRLNRTFAGDEPFWSTSLRAPAPLHLPHVRTDPKRPGGPSRVRTSQSLPAACARLSEAFDAAPQSILAAAVAGYLARLSNQTAFDVPVASAALRRRVRGLEAFFAEYVPWQIAVSPDTPLLDTLAALLKSLAALRSHGTYIRDLPARIPASNAPGDLQALPPASVRLALVEKATAFPSHSDAPIVLLLPEDGSSIVWEYDPAAVPERTVAQMQRQVAHVIEQMAAAPGRSLQDLSVLDPQSRETLLQAWNATSTSFPENACIHTLVEQQVARTPDAVAVVHGTRTLTYRALNERANRLAHRLQAAGVGPDVLVGVATDRSADLVVSILAVLKAGGAYVPLDPAFPRERLAMMIDDARLTVLLTQQRFEHRFMAPNARVVCIDTDAAIEGASADNPTGPVTPAHLSYVIYTSGSTGRPKGVMVEHRNAVNFFTGMDACIRTEPDSVWLAVTSLSFDISVLELLWTLTRGMKVVLYTDPMKEETKPIAAPQHRTEKPTGDTNGQDRTIADLIEHHSVTHLQCTPSMASLLVADVRTRQALGRLRHVMVGGEAFPPELARTLRDAFDGALTNMYGPTETTVWSTTHAITGVDGPIPIGRPIANTQVYVLDDVREPVPPGMPGELYIGGAGVTRGYLRRPELTRERFIPDPFAGGRALYRTGDVARWREDGILEFLGRVDHQVKVSGYRIELGEIEAALAAHPAVRACVVLAREDTPGDKRLVAYMTLQDGAALPAATARSYLASRLPDYMLPAHFVVLEAFPLTPNKKIDRKVLPAPADLLEEVGPPASLPAPHALKAEDLDTNTLVALLLSVWKDVLAVGSLDPRVNLFDLGARSLQVLRVHEALSHLLDAPPSILDLFEHPTIYDLARHLSPPAAPSGAPAGMDRVLETQDVSNERQRADARRTARSRRKYSR